MPSKLEARVEEHGRRIAEHDKQVAAIRKLVLTGTKMINSLATSQKETDRMLKTLIRSLERGGSNGHKKIH